VELSQETKPKVYVRSALKAPEAHALAGGLSVVYVHPRPECPEDSSEDSLAVIPIDEETAVLVIADGAGGMPSGREASALAVQAIVDAVKTVSAEQAPLRTAILNGIEAANQAVLDLKVGAGTTLAIVALRGNQYRTYHVGDSAIVVMGQRGRIKFQSIAHSPIGYAVEAGVFEEDEVSKHVERHVVSNLVGSNEMHIDIGPRLSLSPRDTLLLSSDGLTDNMRVEEIVEGVRSGALLEVSGKLALECRTRMQAKDGSGNPDDLSIITFRLAPPARG
jgi:serine/threonine protein phosphatase PrpC